MPILGCQHDYTRNKLQSRKEDTLGIQISRQEDNTPLIQVLNLEDAGF